MKITKKVQLPRKPIFTTFKNSFTTCSFSMSNSKFSFYSKGVKFFSSSKQFEEHSIHIQQPKLNITSKVEHIPELKHFLVDNHQRFHNYLRISLTERCNLRCQYCMPEQGVDLTPSEKLLTVKELDRLLSMFVKAGVTKVRLTGGEPTVRKDLLEIIQMIHGYSQIHTIAMTTNALVLKNKLKAFKEAGLNSLNISLDSLVEAKYNFITRRQGFRNVLDSIKLAEEIGFSPVKVNCVLMKGFNDDELFDFVEFTKDKDVYLRFIEYMPFDDNKWSDKKLMPFDNVLDTIKSKYNLIKIQDAANDTARGYQVESYKGKVGFISSMTDHFCGSCNRLRITADGNLKVCLFSNKETDLKTMLRNGSSDEEIYNTISVAVKGKNFKHGDMHDLANTKNRPMIKIGG